MGVICSVRETLRPDVVATGEASTSSPGVDALESIDSSALVTNADSSGRVRPSEPIAEIVADIWATLLKVDGVAVEDDFFELGGHSLLITRMVSRLSNAFRIEIPFDLVFETETSTVAGVSAMIESLLSGDAGPTALPGVEPVSRTSGPLPLSFAQRRLWFLDQLIPGNSFYNVPAPYRIRGDLDVPALRRALTGVLARHELLRTVCRTSVNGKPEQVIGAPYQVDLPVVDVAGETPDELVKHTLELVEAEAVRLFDLSTGPVFRATLLRLGPADHVLLVVFHHAFTDGWSMGVFNRDLTALYGAEVAGLPCPLERLRIQYADFAVWQQRWLSGGALETQLRYWRDRLAGAPAALELPTDRPRPAVQSYEAASLTFEISADVVRRLRELAKSERATLYMVLLTAFKALLVRYTSRTDVMIGAPVANRRRTEFEDLIGFFVNTVVLRTDCSGDPSFRELLRRVRETTLGAFSHQDVPFERLVSEVAGGARDVSRNPLVQILFQLMNVPGTLPAFGAADVSLVPGITTPTRFDVEVHIAELSTGISGIVSYDRTLFDKSTIEGLAANYVSLLGRIAQAI